MPSFLESLDNSRIISTYSFSSLKILPFNWSTTVFLKLSSSIQIGAKEAELAEAEALKDECEHWKGVYEELARRVQAAQDAILEATEKIRATYANPTEILQGNVDFPSTFSLDLSAYAGYGIDPNVDYKKSIYPDENSPDHL